MNFLRLLSLGLISLFTVACTSAPESQRPSLPVTIRILECTDSLLGRTLSRVVLEHIRDDSKSVVTLSDDLPVGIIITGIVVRKDVNTAGGMSFSSVGVTPVSGSGTAAGSSSNFSGTIVEGVTLIATLDGKEIASSTYFQTPKRGVVESAQDVAKDAADELLEKLYDLKLVFER